MKRYLTVGIIFGVLVIAIAIISWSQFPTWQNPSSGGFLTLLGATLVGVLSVIQSLVSIWKDLKEETKPQPHIQIPSSEQPKSETHHRLQTEKPESEETIFTDLNGKSSSKEPLAEDASTVENDDADTYDAPAYWAYASTSEIFRTRLAGAFPGLRGVETFRGEEAVNRLEILLRSPLNIKLPEENGIKIKDPIWWFRGIANSQIEKFQRIAPDRFLLDEQEMTVDYITAVRKFGDDMRNFVYVQILPEQPTGVYKYREGWLEEYLQEQLGENHGYYYYEPYGLWKDKFFTREELEDGAAIIDGKPTDISEAEFRIRYVTPYNFVICGQDHVINNNRVDRETGKLLNDILLGKKNVTDLVNYVKELERPPRFEMY
jgi:hypothetical protein